MNNLPLQPLVWFELKNTNGLICEVVTPICEYSVRKDVDSVAYSVLYYNRHTEAPTKEATGFATIDEAKQWAWNHYNEKMQPYVKPSPNWISVDDRLPEQKGGYLAVCREYGDDEVFLGCWHGDGWTGNECVDEAYAIYDTVTVTHWMPIPEFSTMQKSA